MNRADDDVLHGIALILRSVRGVRSLRDVAKDCGVSAASLLRLEQAKHWPSMPVVVRLARHYRLSLDHLILGRRQDRGGDATKGNGVNSPMTISEGAAVLARRASTGVHDLRGLGANPVKVV